MLILFDFVKIPQSNASHSTAPFTREPLQSCLKFFCEKTFNYNILISYDGINRYACFFDNKTLYNRVF